jgi:tetratricopeptide (TPR) repeat protein
LAVAGLALAIILIFVFLPTDQLAGAYVSFFSNHPASVEGRAPIWNDSRQLLSAYPVFGTGLGTYETAFPKYQTADVDWDYTFAHNDYLQLASELGALGFLIFGALFLTAVIKAVSAAWSEDWNARLLGLGCTGALTAIGIHSLADFNLYIPANALLLSWVVGISIGIPSRSHPLQSDHGAETRPATHHNVLRSLNRGAFRTVPVLFACLLVAYATAWIVFQTKYTSDPRAERVFCRFGICGVDPVFAAETRETGATKAMAPLADLVEALKSDLAAPHQWCDVGDAFLRAGQVEEARYCYSNALALSPEIPPVLLRSAKFYHAVRADEVALKLGARLLEKSEVYRASMFDWYRDQKFSVNDVLCRGLPQGPTAAQSYLRYWTDLGAR